LSREGALAPRRAIDLARQIADGLSAAHELGIIHRDLKPDNVLVAQRRDGRETAKVVDFGIAKAVSDSPEDGLTRSGLVIGTPEYMSPEQLLGDRVDARTDIYALGCMLYQMLTGVQPFDAETREQMIRRRLHEPPPHVRDTIPEMPRRLDTLIAHMLARSPNDRLPTAAEASAALDPALTLPGWDPSSIRAPIRSSRGAPTVSAPAADPAMQATMRISLQKPDVKRVASAAIVGSALVLGAIAVWAKSNSGQATQRPNTNAPVVQSPAAAVTPATPTTQDSAPLAPKTTTTLPPTGAGGLTNKPAPKTDTGPKTPAVPSADETSIRATLNRFAIAIGNGEAAIRESFPTMPDPLLDQVKQVYAASESRRTEPPVLGTATITGNRAEVPVTIKLLYRRQGAADENLYQLRYRATLTKRDSRWVLTDLALRP
jgi:eukaryotic-like serine/threonine-protein kinase